MIRVRPSYRVAAVVALGALVGSLLMALPARAAKVSTGCAGLQAAFDASNPGDTITLTKMCTGMTFTLPQHRIVFQGKPGAGAGLDGTDAVLGSVLSGNNVGTTVIRGLTFRDTTSSMGAVQIYGASAPRVEGNRFVRNTAGGGGYGGGLAITQQSVLGQGVIVTGNVFGGSTPASGNTAEAGGGGLYISSVHKVSVTGNTFSNNSAYRAGGLLITTATAGVPIALTGNTFDDNSAEIIGGAVEMDVTGQATIARNTFRRNSVDGPGQPGESLQGGALAFNPSAAGAVIRQTSNLFLRNSVATDSEDMTGGAVSLRTPHALTFTSTNDRYIGNQLGIGATAYGGGLYLGQADLEAVFDITIANAVIVGNELGVGGHGGGIFVQENCAGLSCETNVTLRNSTVAANQVGFGGSGSQLQGDIDDVDLVVHNSIVYGTETDDVAGFETKTFLGSDACSAPGVAFPGAGNICKDPRLKDAFSGNVHQTGTSPTRDKGTNSLVPSSLKKDFEGHARILDSNNDGSKRVDMGADEMRTRARISVGIRRGSVIVAGSLRPTNRGKKVIVTLARKRGGKFRRLGTKRDRLNKRSRYRVTFADPAPGACKVKVVFKGSATTLPGTKTKKFRC